MRKKWDECLKLSTYSANMCGILRSFSSSLLRTVLAVAKSDCKLISHVVILQNVHLLNTYRKSFLLSLQLLAVLSACQPKTEGDRTSNTGAGVTGSSSSDSDGKVDSVSVETVGFLPRLVGLLVPACMCC